MSSINLGNQGIASPSIAPSSSAPFNLEDALMAVQMDRVKNMDDQLQTQIEEVQANNIKATKLNEALKLINSMVDKFGSENDPNKTRGISAEESKALEAALTDLGMDRTQLFGAGFSSNDAYNNDPNRREMHIFGMTLNGPKPTGYSNVSLSAFKTAAATIKGQIDTNSNTQQMFMLRLQSYTNKRGEAFETASTVMKKMHESNVSIQNRI
ncbi:MAG: hypothetical protein ABWY08_04155 [Comamonas sp.]